MTILHLSTARSWRGGEQQIAYLVEELQTIGIRQWVGCVQGAPMEQWCRERGIPCLAYRKRLSADPVAAWQIRQLCRQEQISLVHAHDSHAHTFAVLAASLFGNQRPVVVSRRVDFPIQKSFLSKWKYRHRAVAKIVCVSKKIEEVVQKNLQQPEKTTVIYSGIDPQKFRFPATGILRQEYGLAPEVPLVANVAAIANHKDYFTFVKTAKRLVAQGTGAHFFIIGGDGGEQQAIEQFITKQNLEKHITLTGFRKDIPYILPEIDILLFTSKEEGLGTTLLDAFSAGVPVVATAGGGIPELVRHEETGLLAPVGDAEKLSTFVQRLLADPALRQRLSKEAKIFVQQFSKANTARQTLAVYHQILDKQP